MVVLKVFQLNVKDYLTTADNYVMIRVYNKLEGNKMIATALLVLTMAASPRPVTVEMLDIHVCKKALYESVYISRTAKKGFCIDKTTGVTYNQDEL